MKRVSVRNGLVLLACLVGTTACRDNGLPDRNLPLEEAQMREFRYSVYDATPPSAPVAVAGRHWARSFTTESFPGRLLVQVGEVDGTALYARRGENEPFARLYSPLSPGQWTPWRRLN